jgi:hypothetical protein
MHTTLEKKGEIWAEGSGSLAINTMAFKMCVNRIEAP